MMSGVNDSHVAQVFAEGETTTITNVNDNGEPSGVEPVADTAQLQLELQRKSKRVRINDSDCQPSQEDDGGDINVESSTTALSRRKSEHLSCALTKHLSCATTKHPS